MRPKAIDLFAGPGGLSLGLIRAGFNIIAAVERDADAGETYRHNIGNHTEIEDITKFKPKALRKILEEKEVLKPGEKISLVAGGPPCPGFSLIGRSKISDLIKKENEGQKDEDKKREWRHRFIDDPRNKLFEEFVRYVLEFKPDYFIMENVSGMSSYQIDEDPIVEVIKKKFRGYIVNQKILCASDFGVPQERKRIIFIGHRKGAKPCDFPAPTQRKPLNAMAAIHDLSQVKDTKVGGGLVKVSASNNRSGKRYRQLMREWRVPNPERTHKTTDVFLTSHWTRGVNARDEVLFPHIKSGSGRYPRFGSSGNIRIKKSNRTIYGDLYPKQWDSFLKPLFEDHGFITEFTDGRHYVSIPDTDKKWVMYKSKKEGFQDKMRRIRWDKPSPTIVAHLAKDGYMFIHPWLDRTITVREAARFQSFPDQFQFQGSMASQFRQVGNAVPPLLAETLGRAVLDALSTRDE
jgi:DNA (cytosine-5)-methyltransferase 1